MKTKEIEQIEPQKIKVKLTVKEWDAVLAVIGEVIDEELKALINK
jgi:hypothetical protein